MLADGSIGVFRDCTETVSLKHKTFSAVRWTAITTVARALLQIGQVSVLARLLLPTDYGLMAIVSVVLGFVGTFSDLGINSAFVQRKNVSLEVRSSLFWLNVGVSTALSLAVVAFSPGISWFFGDPRLTLLVIICAPIFIVNALGQQVRMTAEKELNFRPVVLIELWAAVLGFLSAIFAALAGWGVFALVLGNLVSAVSVTSLAWLFVAKGWRPMRRMRMADVRPYMEFGFSLVANNIVNQLNITFDLLIGGRLLGATQLGFYSISRNLVLQLQFLVNPIITRVGFPLISQVQHDVGRVRSIYLKTVNMTISVNAPLYVGMAVFTQDLVTVLLGSKWEKAGPLLRILAMWGMLRSLGNPVGSLLLGMGRAKLALKWNVAIIFVAVPFLWLGSQYDALGMAWALFCLQAILFVPGWKILVRPLCQAGLAEYSAASFRPIVLALFSVVPAYFVSIQFDESILRLIVAVLVFTPLYLMFSYKANRELFQMALQLLGRPIDA